MFSEISASVSRKFKNNETIITYQEFLEKISSPSNKLLRNSAEYIKDVFDHYGFSTVRDINGEKVRRWKLFDRHRVVQGQEKAQDAIYSDLCSFAENRINKIILLHGPNGSSKSSLIYSIMMAMEEYSHLPEGAAYTFNWLFSDSAEKETGLGFTKTNKKYQEDSFARVSPEDITFKLVCDLKDNPIFIIPKKERVELLNRLQYKNISKHLLNGELCQKCQEIYNQLEICYEGDWSKIIRHVQVERFYYSKRLRKGLISVEPQQNTDAGSRAINVEKSYKIPGILSMSSVYESHGDLIDANRGILEFSEIFKRHPEMNKYLLNTAEWGTANLPNFTAFLDCVIFATDNEANLSQFKYTEDWPSFNGRFAYVRVPYLLKFTQEERLYDDLLRELVKDKHVAPHTKKIVALWAVITRLRKSKHRLGKNLTHIQKAVLYDSGDVPDGWKEEDKKNLLGDLKTIAAEFEDLQDQVITNRHGDNLRDAGYEGRKGASFREIENIIIHALHNLEYRHLSPPAIFAAIENISKDKTLHDFLRLNEQQGYLEIEKTIRDIKKYYVKMVQKDIRDSTGLINPDEYLKLFDRYVQHVRAWNRKEKVVNFQTKALEDPNTELMENVEQLLGSPNQDDWRKGILSSIAAWAINNQERAEMGIIPYADIFSNHIEILKQNTFQKYLEQIIKIQKGILLYQTEEWSGVTPEDQTKVVQTVDKMLEKGYILESLKEAVVFTFNRPQD